MTAKDLLDDEDKFEESIREQLDEFKTSIEMQDRRNREHLDHQTSQAKTRFDEMVAEARISLGLAAAQPSTEPSESDAAEMIPEDGIVMLDLESGWCQVVENHEMHVWRDDDVGDKVCPGFREADLTIPISATREGLKAIPEHMRDRIYVVDEDQILRYVDGEWKEAED